MATYKTRIQRDGHSGGWQDDADLDIEIRNYVWPESLRDTVTIWKDVVPAIGFPSNGTKVSWSGPDGKGNITFYDEGTSFTGSAQFPGEEPVDYQGRMIGFDWYD